MSDQRKEQLWIGGQMVDANFSISLTPTIQPAYGDDIKPVELVEPLTVTGTLTSSNLGLAEYERLVYGQRQPFTVTHETTYPDPDPEPVVPPLLTWDDWRRLPGRLWAVLRWSMRQASAPTGKTRLKVTIPRVVWGGR